MVSIQIPNYNAITLYVIKQYYVKKIVNGKKKSKASVIIALVGEMQGIVEEYVGDRELRFGGVRNTL